LLTPNGSTPLSDATIHPFPMMAWCKHQLGQRLKREDIAHIFASPFLRTVQTANQVAEALDLPIKLESV